jgi:hypothetical protein
MSGGEHLFQASQDQCPVITWQPYVSARADTAISRYGVDDHLTEVPSALRTELSFVCCHALRDAFDVRNETTADHPRIIGAIHALLERALRRLSTACPAGIFKDDRCEKEKQKIDLERFDKDHLTLLAM